MTHIGASTVRLVRSRGVVVLTRSPIERIRALWVDAVQDRRTDVAELPDLRGAERIDDVVSYSGHVTRRGVDHLVPAGLGQRRVGGPPILRAGAALDKTPLLEASHHVREPGSVALVRAARAVIRRVRLGASDSMASTRYSKWLSAASARSWVSSTPGSSSTTAIRLSHAERSFSSSHSTSMGRS